MQVLGIVKFMSFGLLSRFLVNVFFCDWRSSCHILRFQDVQPYFYLTRNCAEMVMVNIVKRDRMTLF